MIKVSVFYPKTATSHFDMDYYLNRHIPMVAGLLGDSVKGAAVVSGLSSGAPDAAPTYAAMGHLVFESVEEFHHAFGPHAEQISADIPNYTDVQPVIQVSEIRV